MKFLWFRACFFTKPIKDLMKCLSILIQHALMGFQQFYQLLPIKGTLVYSVNSSIKSVFSLDLWRRFKIIELTEEVKQQGDDRFIKPN